LVGGISVTIYPVAFNPWIVSAFVTVLNKARTTLGRNISQRE
jgi:hypothetical protein